MTSYRERAKQDGRSRAPVLRQCGDASDAIGAGALTPEDQGPGAHSRLKIRALQDHVTGGGAGVHREGIGRAWRNSSGQNFNLFILATYR